MINILYIEILTMRCMTGPVNPIGSVRFLSTKVSEEMTLARSFAIILVSMVQKDWEIFGFFFCFFLRLRSS